MEWIQANHHQRQTKKIRSTTYRPRGILGTGSQQIQTRANESPSSRIRRRREKRHEVKHHQQRRGRQQGNRTKPNLLPTKSVKLPIPAPTAVAKALSGVTGKTIRRTVE